MSLKHMNRRKKVMIQGFVVSIALTFVMSAVQPLVSYAQACGVQLFGLCENEGYFLGGTIDARGEGLLTPYGGFLASNDAEAFIAQVGGYLQGFNCGAALGGDAGRQRNSASFIVLTMLGFPSRTPANHACTVYGTWAARVREYNARGLINFNANFSYVFNTRMQISTLDIAWYGATDTRQSIVIRAADGHVIYAIKKDCGNPVAGAAGFGILTPLSTPATISCANAGATITPSSPEPGDAFSINVSFGSASNGTGGGGTNYSIWVNLPGTSAAYPPVNGPTGGLIAFGQPTFHDFPFGGGTLPGPHRSQPLVFTTAGVKNGTFTITVPGASPAAITCPFSVNVVAKPYSRVYTGDNFAGAGFGESCTARPNAAIIGWNKPVAPYVGSGSQLATFALNVIIDYASGAADGSRPRVPDPAPQWANPKRLAAANAGAGPTGPGIPAAATTAPASTFGGGLNATNIVCAPDYFAARPASATAIAGAGVQTFVVNPASEGTYFRNGDLALLGPGTLGSPGNDGRELTIYVNGNVFIETPITYQNESNFAAVTAIPTFRLVVQGNIFVHPSVGNLDGLYVAQPRPATNNTGFFYTCGNRAWSGNAPQYVPNPTQLASSAGGGCANTRLRVYGAVVAETVKLLRSVGTLRSASLSERYWANNNPANPGDPAEVFIFPPEMWFNSVSSGSGDYDSVTSLPPVL